MIHVRRRHGHGDTLAEQDGATARHRTARLGQSVSTYRRSSSVSIDIGRRGAPTMASNPFDPSDRVAGASGRRTSAWRVFTMNGLRALWAAAVLGLAAGA